MALQSEKKIPSFSGENNPRISTFSEFEKELSSSHPDFLRKLAMTFQELSPQELYICGMIRTRRRSKEISGLLGIEFTTVENHRSHIRRKMGLKRNENLEKFLLQL